MFFKMKARSLQQRAITPLWQHTTLLLVVGSVLAALLLSACGNPLSTNVPAVTPTPTVNLTLQKEGKTQLETFQHWITLMQQNGGDVAVYQQQYNKDQQTLNQAKTNKAYTTALNTLKGHVQTIQIPALKQESQSLLNQLQQQVQAWGKQHTFHDNYNHTTYPLDYEYGSNGIAGSLWAEDELNGDHTVADYQQTVDDLNMWLYNFQQMKADATDKTPYNQPHQTDLAVLQHYNFQNQKVVVVSLSEQALRVYDQGKLVKAWQVTTGQPALPTPPGTWWIEGKKHPDLFKSDEPKNSPLWYPPTPINYSMPYHSNGYYLHDAWWRTTFGPGTNFPHQDPGGDPFAEQGSHGCVNMSTSDAAWLYQFVSLYTRVVIY
jgi:L,D-transpeptidase catalytic domain